MGLTKRDELDLAGLVSKLGNPDSDARAQELMQSNPEAPEFSRQINTVCQSLHAQGEISAPPLSAEETGALAATISARDGQIRAGRQLASRRWRQWGSIAAVITMAAVTWVFLNRKSQVVIAEVIFIPVTASLGAPKTDRSDPAPVQAGELVETRDRYAILTLTNGSRIAVEQGSRLTVADTGQVIELQGGTLFIQAQMPLRVCMGNTTMVFEGNRPAAMVQMTPNGPICGVYAGRARFIRERRETRIAEGQAGTWHDDIDQLHIGAFSAELPGWVKNALGTTKP